MAAGGPRRVSHPAQTSRRTEGNMTTRTGIWRGSIQCVDHGVQVSSVFLKRASRGDAEAERRCVQVAYRWECWADRQRLHSGMMLWSGLIVFQGASDFPEGALCWQCGATAAQQRPASQCRSQVVPISLCATGCAWWSLVERAPNPPRFVPCCVCVAGAGSWWG